MVYYKRAETDTELQQILELQRDNLPASISSEVKLDEGFVTVEHSFELLKRMNSRCQHFIAKEKENLVGYALCMHPDFGEEIDVLRSMFREISRNYTEEDYIVMGQVCIHKDFRRKGIFRNLYNEMLFGIQPTFHTIITEVDHENTRSLNAHYAIGFEHICTYRSDDHNWALIKLSAK